MSDELAKWVNDNLAASKRCDDGREWWQGYIGAMQDVLHKMEELKKEKHHRVDREASE